jgi:hypothetical protein
MALLYLDLKLTINIIKSQIHLVRQSLKVPSKVSKMKYGNDKRTAAA